jgi:hypothetical protein
MQWAGLGRAEEDDVYGADAAAQRHGGVPRRPDPAAGDPAQRARRHGQARVPARLHLPVAAAQGRAPHELQRWAVPMIDWTIRPKRPKLT